VVASPTHARSLAGVFRLLGDPTRLRILMLLDEGEMNVGELCRRLRLPQPTVSHHLARLRRGGLLRARRSGKEVYYDSAALQAGSAGRTLRAVLKRSAGARLGPIQVQLVKSGQRR
jgi:DNA-binding transcriptional ArsR family regulator